MAFSDLPAELMSRVSSYLDPTAALYFRLTCREVFDKTYYDFQDRVRASFSAMNTEGLHILSKISKDARLAPGIRILRLSVYALADGLNINKRRVRKQDKRPGILARYRAAYQQGDEFLMSGKAALCLEQILTRLPSIDGFEIGEWCSERASLSALTATGRGLQDSRDLDHYLCRPYNRSSSCWDRRITEVFSAVLSALSFMKIRMKRLSVVLHEPGMLFGVDASRMPIFPKADKPAWLSGLETALKDLEEMRFSIHHTSQHDSFSWHTRSATWLIDFIAIMPGLRRLQLSSTCMDLHVLTTCSRNPISAVLAKVHLATLQHFELTNATVLDTDLQRFLVAHASTVGQLQLSRIATWGHGLTCWWQILRKLDQQSWSSLRYIKLAWLYQPIDTMVIFTTKIPVAGTLCASCPNDLPSASGKMNYAIPPTECPHVVYESTQGRWPSEADSALRKMNIPGA